MKTARLTAIKQIAVIDLPDPQPGRGEALVRVRSVGVCRSDLHYYLEGRIGETRCAFPHTLGHEPAGDVIAVGEGVTSVRPGDRVAIEPAVSCGHCAYCLSGRANICPDVRFLGTPPNQGVFSELAVFPQHALIPMPDAVSYDEAAVAEPLAIGLHAVYLANLRLGESVGVFGAGTVGLCVLLAARAAGAGKIIVTDPLDYRRRKAIAIGADVAIHPNDPDAEQQILDATGGIGLDIACEAAGEQQAIDHAINSCRPGGRALIIGIPNEDRLSFDPHPARRKELTIQNVRRSNGETATALELIARGVIDVSPLITHHFPLAETDAALRLAADYADGIVKALITP